MYRSPASGRWCDARRRLGSDLLIAGLLVAVLLFFSIPASAQNSTGSLSGTVTDTTGAVVPGATVTLVNQDTQTTRSIVSNGSGFFNFVAVQPGTYAVMIAMDGFATWRAKDIAFTQAATVTLPSIVLQLETAKAEVAVVSANEAIVPTDTGQISNTLNAHMITHLEVAGRDAAELIRIMPGMGFTNGLSQGARGFDPTGATASNTGPIGAYSANGTQPNGAMTMTSDGANLLDPGNQGTQTANINVDQTAEVTLFTNSYGAEFAKGPVTFQAIGKSGSAQFHGSAYFYAKNGILNSTESYIKSQGFKKSDESYYYPGGDIGGPVIIPHTNFNRNHDKLFFYAAYEYMKQQPGAGPGSLINRFIPTEEMMNGNFSPSYLASLGPAFANNYGNDVTQLKSSLYPGGIIPKSELDPNSFALWKTMPKPNADPTTNSAGANFRYVINPPQDRWEVRLRGDYNISERTKLFFSWNHQIEHDQNPLSVWWWLPGALPYPSNMVADQASNVYSANLTHVFSPSLTNEFVFASAKFLNPVNLADKAAVDPSKVGFTMRGLFDNPYTPMIPNLFSGWAGSGNFGGYSAPTFGEKFPGGFGKLSQAPNIADNVSKVLGTHTFKAGFYWDFAKNQQTSGGWQNSAQGTAYFDNWGATSTGNPVADFVSGRITDFYQISGAPVADFKYNQYSFYGQDTWKATRRLTLTYGLRFDHMGQWYPTSGPGLAVWNPAAYDATSNAGSWTGLQWHAINSKIPISGFPSRPFYYEPRLGAAYDLFGNGKTVLRGGFGVYRYQLAYNSVSGNAFSAPLNYQNLATNWGCCVGWNDMPNYSPSQGVVGLGTSTGALTMGDEKTPYTQTWNFTISQRVPWKSVVEFQYSGSRSRDMLLNSGLSNVDKIPLGAFFGPDPLTGKVNDPAASGFPTNDYYPLQHYTGMTLIGHGSYSNYNAFIATWQKQTGRVTFTTNYTFSKALGIRDGQTDNGAGQGALMDPFNMRNNYGVLAFDHTHIFNAGYDVNLPSPIHGNRYLGGVVNGWELSGITQMQSGAPIQPNTGGDLNVVWPGSYNQQQWLGTNAYPNGGVFPILTCDPRRGLSSGQYFNPSCFAPPTTKGQQGNFVWPYIKGPGYFSSDLALFKNFNFKERHQFQFRFQTYNFLNHPLPQFNASGSNSDLMLNFNANNQISQTNLNTTTTGKALNTVGRRVVMLSIKYNF